MAYGGKSVALHCSLQACIKRGNCHMGPILSITRVRFTPKTPFPTIGGLTCHIYLLYIEQYW